MTWPQIGEYTENGITVRVFKPAHADQVMPNYRFFAKPVKDMPRMHDRQPIARQGYYESSVPELRF